MKLKSPRHILILIPAVIGFLVWPLTWIYLAQRSTNYQYPHLWDNFYSFGFVACAVSAVFGWSALIVGILAATKPNGSEEDNPAAFHGTARFATRSEVAMLTTPSEQLQPGSFILSAEGGQGRGVVALPRLATAQHGIILGGSGTGKSRGYFLPNCAAARHTSLVVTDPKSELWTYTSGFHRRARRYARRQTPKRARALTGYRFAGMPA